MQRSRSHKAGTALIGALSCAAIFAGCDSGDDFENLQRPASPIELTAAVTNEKVKLGPSKVNTYECADPALGSICGAGLANVTIANLSDTDVVLNLDGPTAANTAPTLAPATNGSFKLVLEEGDYEVTAGPESRAKSATLVVGPERSSAQNTLLLP